MIYELSVVACCKDEGLYIEEWLNFHHLVGFDHFYIYDAASDHTKNVLQPYIDSGLVTYTKWPDKPAQVSSYNHFLEHYASETKWASFQDLDEFIYPTKATSMKDVLSEFDIIKHVAGLQIGWTIFGSSGHEKRPDGLITENYTRCVDYSKSFSLYTKSIMKTEKIKKIEDPHWLHPKDGSVLVREDMKQMNWGDHDFRGPNRYPNDKIRLNHYFCKSREDFDIKINRRGPDGSGRHAGEFDLCNNTANQVEDLTIQRFVPALKKIMQKA